MSDATNTLLKCVPSGQSLEIIVHCHNEFPLTKYITGLKECYPNNQPDWQRLLDFHGKGRGVYINPGTPLAWQEVILTLDDFARRTAVSGTKIELEGYKTDSSTIQAQRRGIRREICFIETVIYGFVIGKKSDDREYVLFGQRGGIPTQERYGKIGPNPGGAVAYPPENLGGISGLNNIERMRGDLYLNRGIDPITLGLYVEGREETGLIPEEVTLKIIGAYRQEPPVSEMSNVFVGVFKLNKETTIENLLDRHKKAIDLYKSLGGQADHTKRTDLNAEYLARKALREAAEEDPTCPRDAWENESLIVVQNEPRALIETINKYTMKGEGLLHGLNGALALYFLHQFGKESYRKLLTECPSVQEKVRDSCLNF